MPRVQQTGLNLQVEMGNFGPQKGELPSFSIVSSLKKTVSQGQGNLWQ